MSFSCPKKEIFYRGGLVCFFIPKHWNEEYANEGGGTFYEPGDDTGTLRLNVLSFLMKEDATPIQLLESVQKREAKNKAQIEVLSDDRFLLKYSFKSEENGESLIIYCWEVAKMVSRRDYNIAAFTFTVTVAQSEAHSIRQEISSIEEEIKNVRFGLHGNSYEP